MLHSHPFKRLAAKLGGFLLLALISSMVLLGLPARASGSSDEQDTVQPQIAVIPPGRAYRQTNLVSDLPNVGLVQEPLLVNPWGISMTSSSPFWTANNGMSTSTLFRGDVAGSPLVQNAAMPFVTIPGGLPTGTVANTGGATDFVISSGSASGKAAFLFASITGNITGWNPNVPAAGSTQAVIAASNPGHVYTGLAIGSNGGNFFLYAADFANGKIDVYNSNFVLQSAASFPFADPTIPTTAGNIFHPHNIQNIGGSLYVAYAKVGTDGKDQEGVGNGFVRRFSTAGVRDLTFGINNGPLNSPWGLAIAPATGFGLFNNALLVGNFGEGNPSIHAFDATTGAFFGTLQNEAGQGIEIDELWALQFGNGGAGGDPNALYFTAGIAEEEHGLFGSLRATTASATSLVQLSDTATTVGEGTGSVQMTVTRTGDVSGSATVNYATFDESAPGHASQKSDYEIAAGTLKFNPGETSKTFKILLVDDTFVEGSEVINVMLSNPTGTGLGLGSPNVATVTITDNDSSAPTTNPIDDAQFFVRQQYLDFLNREPDAAGFNFWVNQITSCGTNQQCIDAARVNTSAAFFLSIEFQKTGFLAYRANKAAFGDVPLYGEFMRDVQTISRDVIIGQPGAEAQLEANTQAYFNSFVTRPEFVAKYPASLTNEQYVDALLASAGLSPSQVRFFVASLTNAQENPPTTPTTSTGGARPASFGTARFQFNAAQTAMTFTATINNIDFTGSQTADANDNLIAAHIHAGPTVTPTVNGPVVWGFFGNPFNDNNPNDVVNTPFTTGVGGVISGKWDAPEGNGTTLAAQLTNIREGRSYINFHSTQFPGGEIRGNIPAATSFRDALVAGLNGGTETRATVLRKVAEAEELGLREFNSAFVLMEYFGYLRRDPDPIGFTFWLNKLNSFNGDFEKSDMVKSFITSSEYRQRFGPS